jgi:VWFA-related protein
MRSAVVALVLSLCFAPFPVEAQEPASNADRPDDVVELGVELVQFDAVVTDKRGNRVTGLARDDFEVYEDGVRQEITNLSYVEGPPPAALRATPRNGEPAAPPPVLRASDVRRTFALVVDDLFTSFEQVPSVKHALRKFVDEQMQPGDLAAIVLTSKGTGALQQFTADRRLLHAAIERVRFNPRGYAPFFDTYGQELADVAVIQRREPRLGERKSNRPDVVELASEFRQEALSVGSLGALDFVVRGMRELPGRKSLVWLTEGFPLVDEARSDRERRALDAVRKLADRANRAGVVFYPVDVRGLTNPYYVGADYDPLVTPRRPQPRNVRDQQDVMYYISEKTGGFVYAGNDPSKGVERALGDQEGYYSIGYVPSRATFELENGKPKFHEIEVTVKRADLRVRSRTGFFGYVDDRAPATGARGEAEELAEAMTSPVASGDVDLGLAAQTIADETRKLEVRSMLYVDASDLAFAEEGGGRLGARFDVVAFAIGERGLMESVVYREQHLGGTPEEVARYRERGVVYTLNLPIKAYGPYQVRAAIRDKATKKIGTASEFLVVPDVAKKRLATSGLALKSERALGGGANRFARGAELSYFFALYNAKVPSPGARPSLRMRVSLWRDGVRVYEGDEAQVAVAPQTDWRRINMVGAFTLSPRITPGLYTLEVDVVDANGPKKESTVVQYADFEVVEERAGGR